MLSPDGGDVALEIVVPGRGPHVVETLHTGEVLGWSWLFPPYRWTFDAQALTTTLQSVSTVLPYVRRRRRTRSSGTS